MMAHGQQRAVAGARRRLVLILVAVMVTSGMGWLVPSGASAGQAAHTMHGGSTVLFDHEAAWVDWGMVAERAGLSGSGRSGGERWVDVNRSNGKVTLYEGNTALYVLWGSLSRDQGEGYYATASGTYYVFAKNRSLTYTPFADNYITHWVGFDTERRNGFHSYTKDANGYIIPGGGGYTAGCVALPPGAIETLYDFTFVGMRVEVHW